VRRVTDIMGEITAASQEQTAGIEQINEAVIQMDQVTQQNAALVEEAAAAAAALQEQAGNLSGVVSVFRLNGGEVLVSQSTPRQLSVVSMPKLKPAAPEKPSPRMQINRQAAAPVAAVGGEWEEF
jgi:hypothetical protein